MNVIKVNVVKETSVAEVGSLLVIHPKNWLLVFPNWSPVCNLIPHGDCKRDFEAVQGNLNYHQHKGHNSSQGRAGAK